MSNELKFIMEHPGTGYLSHLLPGETYTMTVQSIHIWNDGDVRIHVKIVEQERPLPKLIKDDPAA